MLVRERMTSPVVTVTPDMTVTNALDLMKTKNIRRTPVVEHGEIVGIVSNTDLIEVTPVLQSYMKSWEQKYLEQEITVSQVMKTSVVTIEGDTPIEEAARIMSDNKIGGLPVVSGKNLIGIITETDLFRLFVELMGARATGVRLTFNVHDQPGVFAKITSAIAKEDGNILALTTFVGDDPGTLMVTIKATGLTPEHLQTLVEPHVAEIVDIRVM